MAEQRTAEGKQAKIDYIQRYNKATYDKLTLMLPKGTKDQLKEAASDRGMSAAAFVLASMDEYIKTHPVGE